jgi:hypothetical protein
MLAGLVLLGFCLEQGYHFIITSLESGLSIMGIMVTTVALTAHNLCSYPEGSGEVAAWINFARTLGGVIISYFQASGAKGEGTQTSFGIQAAICALAFLLIITLQVFGKRLRLHAREAGLPRTLVTATAKLIRSNASELEVLNVIGAPKEVSPMMGCVFHIFVA